MSGERSPSGEACAHQRVKAGTEPVPGGYWREFWACDSCYVRFVPSSALDRAYAEGREAGLKLAAGIAEHFYDRYEHHHTVEMGHAAADIAYAILAQTPEDKENANG